MRSYGQAAAANGVRTETSSQSRTSGHTRGSALLQMQRAFGNQAVSQLVQMKLKMGQPGDVHEQEADRVADQVMRMPTRTVQRCDSCEGKEEEETGVIMRDASDIAGSASLTPQVESNIHGLRGRGNPMSESVRAYFEPRFGYDFSSVRIHNDARAAGTAQAINARAFTVGSDIAFASGEYSPDSAEGKRLLAHELTHVVQQGYAGSSVQRQLGTMVQREEDDEAQGGVDVADPNVLMCLALCYLGIPTPVWKRAVQFFLQAVFEEYKAAHEQVEAEKKFQTFQTAFRAYSPINMVKSVLVFATEGKIAMIPVIKSELGKKLQARLLEFLIARGATAAGIAVAAQIARKVAIAIELAIIAGCSAYCGGTALGRMINETVVSLVEGFATGMEIMSSVGDAVVTGLITRPHLTAKATVNPDNWDLSALPSRTRGDVTAVGLFLWSQMNPEQTEQFLRNVTRPLSSYPIPAVLIKDIAAGMSTAVKGQTGWNFVFTPGLIQELSPLTFVQMLKDYKLLSYRQDPAQIAEAAIAAAGKH